jgi:dipeptidyl aminopeptidase/acylaminoacyl peptidase
MKWWLKLIISLIAIVVVAFVGISAYLGYSMTKVERLTIEETPANRGLAYEDIKFPSREDKLTLRGWYLLYLDSEPIIIMGHGAGGHRADPSINMLGIASELVEHGYNVLMFDFRGHGESEGERLSAGYHEKKDMLGAIDFVRGRGFEHIGVLGFSMGATTALMAAAEDINIDGVVADSSFADLTGIMEREFKERSGFPGFFLTPVLFMVKIMYGVDFTAVKPVETVAEIAPRPILFIHGEEDTLIPLEHVYRLKEASENPQNELWIAPNAAHVRAYVENQAEYINKITAFFDEALK